MKRLGSGRPAVSFRFLSIVRANTKSRECVTISPPGVLYRPVFFTATLCPDNGPRVGARGRSPPEPLSSARAKRLYHERTAGQLSIVKVQCFRVNLKKSQWTFQSRKSGHFKPRFCGHFIPRLTTQRGQAAKKPSACSFSAMLSRQQVPNIPHKLPARGWQRAPAYP